jgi:hypothetical protein
VGVGEDVLTAADEGDNNLVVDNSQNVFTQVDVALSEQMARAKDQLAESLKVGLHTCFFRFQKKAIFIDLITAILKRAKDLQPASSSNFLSECDEVLHTIDQLLDVEGSHGLSSLNMATVEETQATQGDNITRSVLAKTKSAVTRKRSAFFTVNQPQRSQQHSGVIKISDFDILKHISQGGSAQVYLARKTGTEDLYAMKVMRKDFIKDMHLEQRVQQERQIMTMMSKNNAVGKGLRNPFVVQLYFAFRSKEYLFIVMEYVVGGDCYSLLRSVNRLPEYVARQYAAEIVLAIDFLHSCGIVHRDIKPDNM